MSETTTIKNDMQAVLSAYLDEHLTTKVAKEILEILTPEELNHDSIVKILTNYLPTEEIPYVSNKLEVLITYSNTNAILVSGSDATQYSKLLSVVPQTKSEEFFLKTLKKALTLGIKDFKVPTDYYSISEKGKLQFNSNHPLEKNFSYNQMVEIGEKSGIRLGTIFEYCLYQATIITNLFNTGLAIKDAFYHYSRTINPNVFKVLKKDEYENSFAFYLAINLSYRLKQQQVFSELIPFTLYDLPLKSCVGWYVF